MGLRLVLLVAAGIILAVLVLEHASVGIH